MFDDIRNAQNKIQDDWNEILSGNLDYEQNLNSLSSKLKINSEYE